MVFYSGFCLLTSSWLFAYFPLSGRGGGSINSKLSPRSRMCSLHSSPCREGGPSSRERCCALCGVVGSSSAARRLCCACGEGALDLRCSATAVPTEERERWRRGGGETEGEGEILSALSLATDRTGFFFSCPKSNGPHQRPRWSDWHCATRSPRRLVSEWVERRRGKGRKRLNDVGLGAQRQPATGTRMCSLSLPTRRFAMLIILRRLERKRELTKRMAVLYRRRFFWNSLTSALATISLLWILLFFFFWLKKEIK